MIPPLHHLYFKTKKIVTWSTNCLWCIGPSLSGFTTSRAKGCLGILEIIIPNLSDSYPPSQQNKSKCQQPLVLPVQAQSSRQKACQQPPPKSGLQIPNGVASHTLRNLVLPHSKRQHGCSYLNQMLNIFERSKETSKKEHTLHCSLGFLPIRKTLCRQDIVCVTEILFITISTI